jgi:hypothetical protein
MTPKQRHNEDEDKNTNQQRIFLGFDANDRYLKEVGRLLKHPVLTSTRIKLHHRYPFDVFVPPGDEDAPI